MGDVDIVTVSSRGQVSIPADIRHELGLDKGSKLLVVSKGDNILLKKIDKSVVDQSFEEILAPMWEQTEEVGLDKTEAEEFVDQARDGGSE